MNGYANSGSLPHTGSDIWVMLIVGLVIIAAGLALYKSHA